MSEKAVDSQEVITLYEIQTDIQKGVDSICLSNANLLNETAVTDNMAQGVYLSNINDGVNNLPQIPLTQIVEVDNNAGMDVDNNAPSVVNYIYEIVCPQQVNVKPVYNIKRGRPKKKKAEEPPQNDGVKITKPAPRTRSGRVVKFPKHIEKDFKKVELEESSTENDDVRISDFVKYEDEDSKIVKEKTDELIYHQRRRQIAAQYRCPKCGKAYLGKTKMMQHIRKYPDHGPVPISDENLNFDVWNYLVDITQKCPLAKRGAKFCGELTNLLHNVSLLTNALFKDAEIDKNHVEVDKVLGNAIGLTPGKYRFNANELYKDVTVLKLITNTGFFKPADKDNAPVEDYNNKEMEDCNELQNNREEPKNKDNKIKERINQEPSLNELMLPSVESGGNILENSTSSEEIINVDQFVNERFQKITEPETENTLNLDLPSLDLF